MLKRWASNITELRFAILASSVLVLFLFCIVPFIYLFEKVFFSGENNSLNFQPYLEIFKSDSTALAIFNTLLVSALVTIFCLLIGVPLAWLLSRTSFPRAGKFRSWLSMPFSIPPYIGAIAWIFLANPSTGLLNKILGTQVFNIYSMAGLIFVETSFLYTFIFLTALSSFDRMDSSFEEAARLSGASPWRVFRDVSLPLMKPALLSGSLLVFLATAASFGVPALIGGPARIYLMTTQIYTFQKMGSMNGLLKAGALSSLLMMTAFITLLVTQRIGQNQKLQTVSGKTSRPSVFELGIWQKPMIALVSIFLFLVFVLPIAGILISSLSRVQGEFDFLNFDFGNWKRVLFEVDETARAISNSFILGASAATVAVVVGLLAAYIQIKTRLPGRGFLDLFASLPYATPGTVVGLALIMAFSGNFLGVFPSLYNTMGLLLIAYFVKYLSFAIKTTADGYRQIDDVLAEASRVSGASWRQTMVHIWLPLLKPALVAAWFLVFMPVLSELTMTILLTGPGLETIGTLIFQLQEYADSSGGGASVLATLVVVGVIGVNFLVKWISKGKYGL